MLPTLRTQGLLTTGEVAKALGIELWRLLRALSLGQVPEPARVGQLRCWRSEDVEAARTVLMSGDCGRRLRSGRAGESSTPSGQTDSPAQCPQAPPAGAPDITRQGEGWVESLAP